MRRGTVIAVLLVPSVVACGLTITGIDVAPSSEAGVIDGGLVGDAPNGNVDAPSGEDAPSLEDAPVTGQDAGFDAADAADALDATDAADSAVPDSGAYAKCLAMCKGPDMIRCADDGTCIVGGQDLAQKVTCPAGVPCEVDCTNAGDCVQGVDCGGATSCKVNCTGSGSCANNGVACAGKSCDVACTGAGACANGVTCTAMDHCGITCTGAGACASNIPSCNSKNGDCTITCGQIPNTVQNACLNGASCTAGTSCTLSCLGSESCVNNTITATAPKVIVVCGDGDNCKNGVKVMAPTSATITCGTGAACSNGGVSCHSPSCTGVCENSGWNFCYQGPNISTTNCTRQMGFGGCP